MEKENKKIKKEIESIQDDFEEYHEGMSFKISSEEALNIMIIKRLDRLL